MVVYLLGVVLTEFLSNNAVAVLYTPIAIELARQLVDCAAEAGADAVKFQTFDAMKLVTRAAPKANYQQRTTDAAESQLEMLRKLELPTATLSIKAVPAKAEITDEALLPSKFFKAQDPKLDKKAVLDALKAKEDVPGAVLSNGGETLSIRGG